MKKGINNLSLKLIRRSPSFAFSIGIRGTERKRSFNDNDWITDYSTSL
jgi:hypothetical protein